MPPVSGTSILRYTANSSATCPFQDTEEVTIIVNDPPSATIGTSDLDNTVCLNDVVNLDFNIVGNIGNYSITYFDPAGAIQNEQFGYPEIGDVILFDGSYYEIDNVRQSQLIGGSPQIYDQETGEFEDSRMNLIAIAHNVRRSQVQIEDRIY